MASGLDKPFFSETDTTAARSMGLQAGGEDVWIDVIRKMDDVYADLVRSQTELEEKNSELQDADTFISSVLGAMTDVLIVCDAKGRVQKVNRKLMEITGKSERELVGINYCDLVCPKNRAQAAGFVSVLASGKSVEPCEIGISVPKGPPAYVSLNCAPRRDQRGRLAGMVMVGRPIDDLKRAYRERDAAREKLDQAQERLLVSEKMAALGRLVAGVAHELNNPISFVFGNMYALKRYGNAIRKYLSALDGAAPEKEMAELRQELKIDKVISDIGPLVDGTLEGAERVRDIVEDLRRFSSNQQEIPETFNLMRLVHTATDWVIKAQRVKPEILIDGPEMMEVCGRKGQVHQILVNLVQNAADVLSGREDGRIWITCTQADGFASVAVSDNGTGITADIMDKLFEPFFTTKPIGTGTGLGLYVSYNMAMKQGGELHAANRPAGGAEFTLRLPVNVETVS